MTALAGLAYAAWYGTPFGQFVQFVPIALNVQSGTLDPSRKSLEKYWTFAGIGGTM